MKKVSMVVLALVVSVAFVTAVFAQATTEPRQDTAPQTAPTSTPEKAAPKGKWRTYIGDITNVDTMAKTITVKGKKGEMTFDVSMAKWKPYKSMDEVKQGDTVTVRYHKKEGKTMASWVTKGKPSGLKQESTAASEGKKADKGMAPMAPTGGVKQESTPANK